MHDPAPPARGSARRPIEPEHLYEFAGLPFLLVLAIHFLDTLSRVLLIACAAGLVAVGLNAVVSRLPVRRKWATTPLGVVMFGSLAAAFRFGGRTVLAQLGALIENVPAMEQELRARAVPYALLLGTVDGMAEVVPIIGPWAGGIAPVAGE